MRANSFGALRLIASLLVVYTHSFPMTMGAKFSEPFVGLPFSLGTMGVYIFFAISGILVTKSFIQSDSVTHFFVYRIVRIFPGLTICLLFCALILGASVTSMSLLEYFSSPYLWSFMQTDMLLLGDVQTTLPGVFVSNPLPSAVNDSIWTLPWELRAYVLLALGGILFSIKRFQAAGLILFFLAACNSVFLMDTSKPSLFWISFFLGGALYLLKLRAIPALALLGVLALFMVGAYATPMFDIFFCGWIAVLIYLVGFGHWGASKYLERYDLSYGIYIYSFPAGQLLVLISGVSNPWIFFVLNVAVAVALAMLSWLYIEKPVLVRKRSIADKISSMLGARVLSETK